MKIPRAPHRWTVGPKQAVAIQARLATRVRRSAPRRRLAHMAGLDCAFARNGAECVGGVVLWDLRSGSVIEQHVARRPVRFPYVPGLLSFREAPALLAALRKLRTPPDALLCDGHGLAHPRRFGVACHLGVVCDLPTLGCAKSRLVGRYREPGRRRGSRSPLLDDGEVIGTVLRTQDGVRPIFVSIGHRLDLRTAERLALDCSAHHRLPEPARLADRLVGAAKRRGA